MTAMTAVTAVTATNAMRVAALTRLLREAEDQHGSYEATAPRHHWSDWYAAFIVARKRGRTVDEARDAASAHMEEIATADVDRREASPDPMPARPG